MNEYSYPTTAAVMIRSQPQAATAPQAPSTAPVTQAVNRLGNTFERLEMLLSTLASRLEVVMVPAAPTPPANTVALKANETPLSSRLLSLDDRAGVICDRLGDLSQRLGLD